ncbi:MAG: GIN domain-containing protein [Brevundimonas sp.]
MIKTLFIIAGAGAVLAAGSLAGAAALSGSDLRHNDWTWSVVDGDSGGDNFHMQRGHGEPDVTRTLAWTGGDRLQIEVPFDVTYVQGTAPGIVITGPKDLADRVRIVGDRLALDDDDRQEHGYIRWTGRGFRAWSADDQLKITVTAPAVSSFDVVGSSDLQIRDYDQPSLNLIVSGSGDVTARGETRTLQVDVSGSGDADLAALSTVDADVRVSGSGDVRVGPTGKATVDISGSGDVDLTRRATSVSSDVSGTGDIEGA